MAQGLLILNLQVKAQALLWFLVFFAPLISVIADKHYRKNWTVWNNNDSRGTLYVINKDGLTGRWTGLRANRSDDTIDYEIWFVNSTSNSYTLSVIILNLPQSWNNTDNPNVNARIIWTANRGHPVGENASFSFTEAGNLELKDENGIIVWDTNSYSKGVETLWLTNMGNIILQTNSMDTIWQSFDELTDTLMERRVLKPGKNLTSWASSTNSSAGDYSLVMESGGLVLYANFAGQNLPYWIWTSAANNNNSLYAVTKSTSQLFAAFCRDANNTINLQLGSNLTALDNTNMLLDDSCGDIASRGQRLTFGVTGSAATFIKLLPDGNLKVYSWNYTTSSWMEMYSLFQDQDLCSLPNKCGNYRVCRNSKCGECFGGTTGSYVEIDKNEPDLGCKPVNSGCSTKLTELQGYQYFAIKYESKNSVSKQQCQDACSGECMCTAAFFNATESSCFLVNNTVGTVEAISDNNVFAFLKVKTSAGNSHSVLNWKGIAGGIVGGLVGLFIIIFVALKCMLRSKNHTITSEDEKDEEVAILDSSLKAMLPTKFSFEDLKIITEDFSQSIGAGAFGEVYKGKLADGTDVAVKKLEKLQSHRKEFYTEIAILGRSHHQNLVRLLGYCAKASKSLLVYEYMKNGSLDRWLFGDKPRLSWKQRFDIIVGTAKGLAYLHEECSDKTIHLDLKPQNILLDTELRPKIADFGISKLVDRQQSLVMTNMRGTPGYLAPEWLVEGAITEKADVYGYGVVVLEVLSGKKSRECLTDVFNYYSSQKGCNDSIWKLIDCGIADCVEEEADRVLKVASLCIQDNPSARPSMSRVVQMLEGIVQIPKVSSFKSSTNIQSRLAFMRQMESDTSTSDFPSSSSSFFTGGTNER